MFCVVGAVAKEQGRGLQNPHAWVQFPPAPPLEQICIVFYNISYCLLQYTSMKHSDFHISFYGIVAGVLIGVGIVTLPGQKSLFANTAAVSRAPTTAILRNAPARADFVRRNIVQKNLPLWNDNGVNAYFTIKTESSSSSAKSEVPTACDAVRKAVEKIRRVYSVVADAVSNAELRKQMFDVLDDASNEWCAK